MENSYWLEKQLEFLKHYEGFLPSVDEVLFRKEGLQGMKIYDPKTKEERSFLIEDFAREELSALCYVFREIAAKKESEPNIS